MNIAFTKAKMPPKARMMVGALLSKLESAFESQDPRTVAAAREEVSRALDELEGESFL